MAVNTGEHSLPNIFVINVKTYNKLLIRVS